VEQLEGLADRLPLDALGQQRRGRDGNRAAGALEANVLDAPVGDVDVERELVAAERVYGVDHVVRAGQLAEVTGLAVVIEDHLAIKVLQLIYGTAPRRASGPPSAGRRPTGRCTTRTTHARSPQRRIAPSPASRNGARCGSRRPRGRRSCRG